MGRTRPGKIDAPPRNLDVVSCIHPYSDQILKSQCGGKKKGGAGNLRNEILQSRIKSKEMSEDALSALEGSVVRKKGFPKKKEALPAP